MSLSIGHLNKASVQGLEASRAGHLDREELSWKATSGNCMSKPTVSSDPP